MSPAPNAESAEKPAEVAERDAWSKTMNMAERRIAALPMRVPEAWNWPADRIIGSAIEAEQRVDPLLGCLVVVERKSVERVPDIHVPQRMSCLPAADVPLGLLISFNTLRLKDGNDRRIHPDAAAARALAPDAAPPHPPASASSAARRDFGVEA